MKLNRLATLALTLGATLLATTAHAQITITGGEIIFMNNNGQVPDGSPVAGYLETAQGRIQSGNHTFAQVDANPNLFANVTAGSVPVLLRVGSDGNLNHSTANRTLLATGSAFTPNGPVLFTNIPVSLTLGTTEFLTSERTLNAAGFGFTHVARKPVNAGQFGNSGSISGMIGGVSQTVSLAPNNFNFSTAFPAPATTPTTTPIFTLEPNTTNITTTTFTTQDWEERTTLAPTPNPNANLRGNGIISRIFPTLSLYQ